MGNHQNNLRHLPVEKRNAVDDFLKAGWQAQVTHKGHVRLLAPDGETTAMVSRNKGASVQRARADLKRWRNRMTATEAPTKESTTLRGAALEEATENRCADCGEVFPYTRTLGFHRWKVHGAESATQRRERERLERTGAFTCPECGAGFDKPNAIAIHRKKRHGVETQAERQRRKKAEAAAAPPPPPEPVAEPVVEPELPPQPVAQATPPAQPAPEVDVLHEHLINLPEGEDAEDMIAKIRVVVAAPLVGEIERMRRRNADLEAEVARLRRVNEEHEARQALLREALSA